MPPRKPSENGSAIVRVFMDDDATPVEGTPLQQAAARASGARTAAREARDEVSELRSELRASISRDEEAHASLDGKLTSLGEQVEKVDDKFEKLDERFDTMNDHVSDLRADIGPLSANVTEVLTAFRAQQNLGVKKEELALVVKGENKKLSRRVLGGLVALLSSAATLIIHHLAG